MPSLEELESRILELPVDSRAILAERILASLDDLPDEENERLWLDEAERRLDEVRSGKVNTIPAETAISNLRNKLKNGN